MGRRSSIEPIICDPPHPCAFGCGAWLQSKYGAIARSWLWFTGYGERPVHFCPVCQCDRAAEIANARAALNRRPADYPRTRAQWNPMYPSQNGGSV